MNQTFAMKRYALLFAWERARHVVRCYQPGSKNVRTEARALLPLGWHEARLAAEHGYLSHDGSLCRAPARNASLVILEIEALENRDTIGPEGFAKLRDLDAELSELTIYAA